MVAAARLAALDVGDPPELWRLLGFEVDDESRCRQRDLQITLGAPGHGVTGWAVIRMLADGTRVAFDTGGELPGVVPDPGRVGEGHVPDLAQHPNGVVCLDHLVVATPDLDRTVAALVAGGLELRRTREAGAAPDGVGRIQAFFVVGSTPWGPTVLEVVGPAVPSGDGPARFWGLAFSCQDLGATAAFLGDRLGPVRDAVQPGRRIASLRSSAGSSVPMAFMSVGTP